jgi:hypothetical protein
MVLEGVRYGWGPNAGLVVGERGAEVHVSSCGDMSDATSTRNPPASSVYKM